jgi:protein SCO1/2
MTRKRGKTKGAGRDGDHWFLLVPAAAAVMLVLPALGLLGYQAVTGHWPWSASEQASAIGGPFSLVDASGQPVTDQTYRGKWLLLFFGYTHCPDVCPTTLADVAQAWHDLGAVGDMLQPVFITVDPERDTPKVMHDYVAAFDGRIAALTGSPAQIAAAAKAYRAYYAKSGDGPDYAMEHSAVLYLMRPDGSYAGFIPPDTGSPTIVQRIKDAMAKG